MQQELFHESWENALHHTIEGLGGYKEIANRLWPSKSLDSAYAHLKNCLREDKDREKLSLHEIKLITQWGCEAGIHASATHFNMETGYDKPEPVTKEEEYAKLQKDFVLAARAVEEIGKRLERFNVTDLRATQA